MPSLTNPKHERFAQELAKGVSANKAYVIAGYAEHRQNASGLARKEPIAARVQDILAEHAETERQATARAAEALKIDKEWVLARLVRNAERSLETEEGSVANRALELIGKELGMFIDRSEIDVRKSDISPVPVTPDEWAARHGGATAH